MASATTAGAKSSVRLADERYERTLETLGERERAAIVARIELGQDWDEVGRALGGASAEQARSTVCRAVLELAGATAGETATDTALGTLAAAVADRAPVDWDERLRRAPDERERGIVRQMQVIEQVARSVVTRGSGVSLVGRALGHIRIVEKIGEGGMGQVFRAHDEHLKRDVAIKVLPPGLLADDDARRRFRNEALSLSRVNHPNVETVYDFDTQDGIDYLVLEYLPGKTLRTLLADGALPEREVVRLGIQLAEGLRAAHKQGIVHRDLKPGNVMIMPEGQLKILDFGLAKLVHPADGGTTAETLSLRIVGTLPYMSPEQLCGGRVDGRADIYAVGALLYEMATARRPFPALPRHELVRAIMEGGPTRPTRANPRMSRELERITLKALHRDPSLRYQDAREILGALERLRSRVSPLRAVLRYWPAVAIVAGLGLSAWIASKLIPPPEPPKFGASRQLTSSPRREADPALSPDGAMVAYTSDEAGDADIWILDTRAGTPVRLTDGPDHDTDPAWFPDGSSIVFQRANAENRASIWEVARLGGSPVLLLDDAGEPAISPDGRMLAFVRPAGSGLMRVAVASLDDPSRVHFLTDDHDGVWDHEHPTWSPDGRSIAYSDFENLWIVPVSGGSARPLTSEHGYDFEPKFSPDGRWIYFSSWREGTLAIWRVDDRGRRPERVTLGTASEGHPSLAASGERLVYATSVEDSDLVILDRMRGTTFTIGTTMREYQPSLAPDGRAIAFVAHWDAVTSVWLQPLVNGAADGPPRALVRKPGTVGMSAFSPDGRRFAFSRVLEGERDIWVVPVEGGPPRNLTNRPGADMHPAWSPDGSRMAWVSSREGGDRLFVGRLTESGALSGEQEIPVPPETVWHPSWSPDGAQIAFVGVVGQGLGEVWLTWVDDRAPARQLTVGAGVQIVRWDRRRRELLASGTWRGARVEMRAVSPLTGASRPLDPPIVIGPRGAVGDFDVSDDGSLLAYRVERAVGDLWMTVATERP